MSRFVEAGVRQRGAYWDETGGRVSTMLDVLSGLDPKPGDLPMARLKLR